MRNKILCLFDAPSKNGQIVSEGSGLEFVRLLMEFNLTIYDDCELRSIYPYYARVDNVIDLNKTDPNSVLLNGHYVHKDLPTMLGTFLSGLSKDPNRLIIGFGQLPLLLFYGELSIHSYRGSMIQTEWGKFIPTFDMPSILRMFHLKYFVKKDIARALQYRDAPFPAAQHKYLLDLDYPSIVSYLQGLLVDLDRSKEPVLLSVDIETFRRKEISCIGIARSRHECLVIPFLDFTTPNYSRFSVDEELTVVLLLKKVLTHPRACITGQNFHYDMQYIIRQWGIYPNYQMDSMHMFHCLYPGELPKDLTTLASLFCEHFVYWKDQGKEIHDAIKTREVQLSYWEYNAKDCCTTYECTENILEVIRLSGLLPVWEFQQTMFPVLLEPILRGCRYDREKQLKMKFQMMELRSHYAAFFERVIPSVTYFAGSKKGSAAWYDSPTKTKTLLYDVLKCPVQLNKKTKQPSTDDPALQKVMVGEPLLRPLLEKLLEYRSLGVFVSNFLSAEIDPLSKRMHTFYNLSGAGTFRLASKEDSFGNGGNLQNIPKGDK